MNTASANYRPGTTNNLRKKVMKSKSKEKSRLEAPPKMLDSSGKKMDPADDSFNISPNRKYPTSKKKSNELLSGASEFDNMKETTAKDEKKDDDNSRDFDEIP